ncbi:hypothetical protein AYI69_g2223 [Smittium culicis]|uniref:Uncharacterized protein n=1 Tax=Smittium culicis TaxID=133412 RepID=A0A1R1YN09_9FUNG|nr:hypothetical protein AYI69_g2223 [Smittium culicis]
MGIAVQTQVNIPQQINLPRVSESNVVNLQQLNVALFPIKYSINFYKQVLSGETIGRLATVDKNKCVGAIVGRLQPLDFTKQPRVQHARPERDVPDDARCPALLPQLWHCNQTARLPDPRL